MQWRQTQPKFDYFPHVKKKKHLPNTKFEQQPHPCNSKEIFETQTSLLLNELHTHTHARTTQADRMSTKRS